MVYRRPTPWRLEDPQYGTIIWAIPDNSAGIYMISIAGHNKCYIGASVDVRRRLATHCRAIVEGVHPMSAAAKSAGWGNLRVAVLEWAEPNRLAEREASYIEYFGVDNLYNTLRSGRHESWRGEGRR